MDSTDPRTQPPQQQRQQQPHPTTANPQQQQHQPPQHIPQQPQPQQPQPQPQHLHQQPNIHPPQHAQQNQPAGYAQQHAYTAHPLHQFHPCPYQQTPYRPHYNPQQFPHQHIAHAQHYHTPYPYTGHSSYPASWTPSVPAQFPTTPVSTPPTQGITNPKAPPLPQREKVVLKIIDPKTRQQVNLPEKKATTNPANKPGAAAENSAKKDVVDNVKEKKEIVVVNDKKDSVNNDKAPKVEKVNSEKDAKDESVNNQKVAKVESVSNEQVAKDTEVNNTKDAKDDSVNNNKDAKNDSVNNTKVAEEEKVNNGKNDQGASVNDDKDVQEVSVKNDNDVKDESVADDKEDAKDDSTEDVVAADGEKEETLHYEPGQYNPMSNRSGKKKYSREFMVEVCEKICKLNIFNEGASDNNLSGSYPQLDVKIDMFAPKYQQQSQNFSANRSSDALRRQNPSNYMGRSSTGQERQRKVIAPSSSLTNEVELKTVANPWRPGKEKKEDVPLDAAEVEDLKKKFRSILNKLTPNNFENLATAVTDLQINTEQKLGEVIDIVFAKALAEPGYCVLYGQMCSHLKKITAGSANFGNTLLKRCQYQFDADIYGGLNVDERKKKIEEEENPDVKKQLSEELYEDMYRSRMRGLGLIKFIGELYKIEMLNDDIMFDCIHRLLCDTSSEESLECLCDLLTTIGEKLDRSSQKKTKEKKSQKIAAKPNVYAPGGKSLASVISNTPQKVPETITTLDPIFEQLHIIRKNKELPLSLRIRFKLLDVCELREKENWQSKKAKDNNPKKIEEIREAHQQKLEAERQKQAMGGRRSQEGRRGLGQASGSSNQISSLGNDSSARGGMHTSASSQAIRDQSYGDDRQQNHSQSLKFTEQHQQNAKDIKGKLLSIIGNKAEPESLRPVTRLGPYTGNANNNSNNSSSNKL